MRYLLLFLCAAALYAQETSQNFPPKPESAPIDSGVDSATSLEATAESQADSHTPENPDAHSPTHSTSAHSTSARATRAPDERKASEDRVEIIDYKRGKILGYMVLRNGNIIRRVLFKQPQNLHPQDTHLPAPSQPRAKESTPSTQAKPTSPAHSRQAPTHPAQKPQESTPDPLKLESSALDSHTTQSEQESYLSSTPLDKDKSQDKHQERKSRKHAEADPSTSSSHPQTITQEIGVEKSRINKTYKNREWDKKKIPHDVQTRVIDIRQ